MSQGAGPGAQGTAGRTSRRQVLGALAGVAMTGVSCAISAACGTPGMGADLGRHRVRQPSPGLRDAPWVDDLLATRAKAYRAGDARAWSSGVLPTAGWADPATVWRAMRALEIVDVAFGAAHAEGSAFVAEMSFRLSGHDTQPSSVVTSWEPVGERLRQIGPPQLPWDEVGVQVVLSGPAVAVGAVDAGVLQSAGATAEAAAGDVGALWPGAALRPVVWLPRDMGLFDRGAGGGVDAAGVPAVTIGPVQGGRSVGADRIVINPELWGRLLPEGKHVVLRHEVTHLPMRRDRDSPRPLVLEEGLCEYVAYRASGIPLARVAAPLMSEVRRTGLPNGLPRGADFRGERRSIAYAASWLLCQVVAELSGEAALVSWVRAARGEEVDDPGVLAPLLSITGLTRARLLGHWRARVASVARS